MPHKDPEKLKAYKAQWYLQNRERVSQKAKAYRNENHEKLIELNREYYRANREEILRKQKDYSRRNEEKVRLKQRVGYLRRKKADPLQFVYQTMRSRCENPRHHSFRNYGGRGIILCKQWRDSFEVFKEWALNNGWEEGLNIDRIDNNGSYEPLNCRFVTKQVSGQKRRNSKLTLADAVEIKQLLDQGFLQREIAEKFGVSRRFVSNIKTGDCWTNA